MQLWQLSFILFFFFFETHGSPLLVYVVPVQNNQGYRCITEPEVENPVYNWSRQGWSGLPEGVKVEEDKLYFLNSTPELNGLYICEVASQSGAAAGSVYRHHFTNDIHSEL